MGNPSGAKGSGVGEKAFRNLEGKEREEAAERTAGQRRRMEEDKIFSVWRGKEEEKAASEGKEGRRGVRAGGPGVGGG